LICIPNFIKSIALNFETCRKFGILSEMSARIVYYYIVLVLCMYIVYVICINYQADKLLSKISAKNIFVLI